MLENTGVTNGENLDAPQEASNSTSSGESELLAYLESEEQNRLTSNDDAKGETTTESEPTANSDSNKPVDKFTVKINGEEVEVTKDELITHYQKEKAADRKFEEAASIRKDSLAKQQQYETEAHKLQKALSYFGEVVQQWDTAGLLTPPNPALLDSDPVAYMKQERDYNARVAEIQKAQAAQAYLVEQQKANQQVQLQQHLEAEARKLPELIPEWKDSKAAEKEQGELVNYLKGQGYNERDLEELSNSRASNIALVVKAMRYDGLKQRVSQSKQTPTAHHTIGAQASNSGKGTSTAFNKFKQSGNQSDLADVFSEMFS